jgi:hypothetical protein
MSDGEPDNDQPDDEETARRRDEVIKRMLNTPPQPRKAKRQPSTEAKERLARKARSKPPS